MKAEYYLQKEHMFNALQHGVAKQFIKQMGKKNSISSSLIDIAMKHVFLFYTYTVPE